jgi:TPR repeat protein
MRWWTIALVTACHASAAPKPRVEACDKPGELAAPFVQASQRAALMAAMTHGLVVVNDACSTPRVLVECAAAGHYGRIDVPPEHEEITVESADANANGLPHAGKLVLDVTGRWSTIHTHVARAELTGTCEGATHFVESVDIDSAGAPVRQRLVAIDSDAGETARLAPTSPCGGERVWRDDKCTAPSERAHQCRFGELEDCRVQCANDHAGSCTTLAVMIAAGVGGVAKDGARVAQLLDEACRGGEDLACRHSADMLASGEAGPRDEPRAKQLFQRACDHGVATACTYLASIERSAGNLAQSGQLLVRACDGGDRRGCSLAAVLELSSAKAPDAILARLADTCDAGDSDGCNSLGTLLLDTRHTEADAHRAAELFERACADKAQGGCSNLGRLLLSGVGVAKDEARGVKLLHEACDAGIERACEEVEMHELDVATASGSIDQALAKERASCAANHPASCAVLTHLRDQFGAQCDSGTATGCANLAEFLVEGIGGDKDDVKARALFQRACDAKLENACKGLAITELEGRGGPVDVHAAIAILKAGCTGNVMQRCVTLGDALVQGIGVAKDFTAGIRAFELGCNAGNAEACEEGGTAMVANPKVPDAARAEAMFGKGCALDRVTSCSKQGAMLVKLGKRDAGVQLLREACKAGDGWACTQLENLGVAK